MDASMSDGSAVSRGPDADVGMFPDAIGATPAFLFPAVEGFLPGVSVTVCFRKLASTVWALFFSSIGGWFPTETASSEPAALFFLAIWS